MTNGEKIQTILDVDRDCTEVNGKNGIMTFSVSQNWWNAEYKEPSSSGKPNKSIEEKCPCYHCEHFEIKGWSHCKIHEGAYGDSRCNDYHKINQKPNKSEIPTGSNTDAPENNVGSIESTTKNDLGVDLISRADVNRIICEYRDDAAEAGSERDLERAYGANAVGALISKLPSVTPQEPILNKLKEKDEAKAVRYEGDGYADGEMVYDMAFCPNCEHEFEEDSENWECDFCPNCGQRLRW